MQKLEILYLHILFYIFNNIQREKGRRRERENSCDLATVFSRSKNDLETKPDIRYSMTIAFVRRKIVRRLQYWRIYFLYIYSGSANIISLENNMPVVRFRDFDEKRAAIWNIEFGQVNRKVPLVKRDSVILCFLLK